MYDKQLYSRTLLLMALAIFVIIWVLKGRVFDISIIATALSAAGATLLIDKLIFKQVIWKIAPNLFYKWLTTIPFLGGKWEGHLYSSYIYPDTGMPGEPIPAKMEIFHEFESIHIRLETNKSYSSSYVSDISIDEGKQKYLCYLYGNDADKDREINPKHDGAVKLRIKHDGEIKLEGHYWTGRSTTGKMEFKRTSNKNSRA
ncbi:hypothetical protein [Planococcus faecalis]|uniref:CD-NTase-associated protein 15 domain-containing protein n=1 Tax=Planococcus faecalis TaxID=1598147 RepID=A0ABM6IT83_9BACL|nr:hypothetical protein [Planococcus faecalis]AQU79564.1 hypothetical protein AJGP001_09965 [Planococcus faecalis]OHX53181.1 hypothetical protein BB777_11020 [Planococcus faecalis]